MTSSPGPTPIAINAMSSASVPEETPTANLASQNDATASSRALTFEFKDEMLRVTHTINSLTYFRTNSDVLSFEIEQGSSFNEGFRL